MRAIEISQYGGPGVLRPTDRPDPEAVEGEVLIRVAASGVNRPDVAQRTGGYAPPAGASDIPGLDIAGEIIAGDERAMAAAGFKIGDRVCALVAGGGYASLCVAPVGQCLPIPRELTAVQAASLPETFFTVWTNLWDRGRLQEGETLLVQGGTSGIGVTAIQMAKVIARARVIATAGSEEKCQACLSLGADHAINYRAQDFVEVAAKLTEGRGVDVILDIVGGDYLSREVECLADDGRLVTISSLTGKNSGYNEWLFQRKRLTITGSTLRARPVSFKSAIAASLKEHVWPALDRGAIRPVIHATFPAERACDAHSLMESSRHIGKIVLTW